MIMLRRFVLLLPLVVFGQAPPLLDEWVGRAMQEFDVPGVAIGILKDGKVVATRGYGVRKMGVAAKVDERTLFGIASNTKAFTTTALAMLVEEGKLAWDDKVTKHLPGFAMYDPWVTREVTVRDLVTHRTGLGLGAGDLMFWPDTTFTRAKVVAGVRYLKPETSMRSEYAYNNTMFVVAGEVIEAVSGMRYEEFVKARIFEPLGMREARFSNVGLEETANTAVPHSRGWRLEGELQPIRWTQDEVWAAAAGIKANVTDLTQWVKVHLAGGVIEGERRLFSERTGRQLWAAQTVIHVGQQPKALVDQQAQFAAYGLGFSLKDYRGRKVVQHSGGLTGMVTQITFVPGLNLGVIVLTNQEEGGAFGALTNLIVDHYMGANSPDWIGVIRAQVLEGREKARAKELKVFEERAKDSQPSLALSGYAQAYRDAWYGRAVVSVEDGGLRMKMEPTPAMDGSLKHFQHNTFVVKWKDNTIPDAFVTFHLNRQGKVERMVMEATSDLADFSFDYHHLEFLPEGRRY
jgi:CubicO group peptidase (beta-lactamase class C family)